MRAPGLTRDLVCKELGLNDKDAVCSANTEGSLDW